jgi:hypothetical protein
MAVCPTLRTAAVGVTRAGRRAGGRRLAQGNRMSVESRGGPLLLCDAAEKTYGQCRVHAQTRAFVSRFRGFAQWLGYCRACQPKFPTITCQINRRNEAQENCVVGIMTTCVVVDDGLSRKRQQWPRRAAVDDGGGLSTEPCEYHLKWKGEDFDQTAATLIVRPCPTEDRKRGSQT